LLRDDGLAISKRDKGKGTSPIPLFLHHPATAGWDGKIMHFTVAKVWFLPFCVRGQFCEPGPFPEPTDFEAKNGSKQPASKKLYCFEKSWLAEIGDFVTKTAVFTCNSPTIRRCGLMF
jgi:hypothetical protein